jgi:hypothetical protein
MRSLIGSPRGAKGTGACQRGLGFWRGFARWDRAGMIGRLRAVASASGQRKGGGPGDHGIWVSGLRVGCKACCGRRVVADGWWQTGMVARLCFAAGAVLAVGRRCPVQWRRRSAREYLGQDEADGPGRRGRHGVGCRLRLLRGCACRRTGLRAGVGVGRCRFVARAGFGAAVGRAKGLFLRASGR